VPKEITEIVNVPKKVVSLVEYSNDSGDHLNSGDTSISSLDSVDGSLHKHSGSDCHGHWCKSSSESECDALGNCNDSSSDSSSSSSSDCWGSSCSSSSDSSSDCYGKWCSSSSSSSSDCWGKWCSSSSDSSSSSSSDCWGSSCSSSDISSADHSHAHDGNGAYIHAHASRDSISSISSDSSADLHEKVDIINVPTAVKKTILEPKLITKKIKVPAKLGYKKISKVHSHSLGHGHGH